MNDYRNVKQPQGLNSKARLMRFLCISVVWTRFVIYLWWQFFSREKHMNQEKLLRILSLNLILLQCKIWGGVFKNRGDLYVCFSNSVEITEPEAVQVGEIAGAFWLRWVWKVKFCWIMMFSYTCNCMEPKTIHSVNFTVSNGTQHLPIS